MIVTPAMFAGAAVGAELGSSVGIAAAGTAIAGTGFGAVLGGLAGAGLAKGAVWCVGAVGAGAAGCAATAVSMAGTAAAFAGGGAAFMVARTLGRRLAGRPGIEVIELMPSSRGFDVLPEPEWIVPPLDLNSIPPGELKSKTLAEIQAEHAARHRRAPAVPASAARSRTFACRVGASAAWAGLTLKPPAEPSSTADLGNSVVAWAAWAVVPRSP